MGSLLATVAAVVCYIHAGFAPTGGAVEFLQLGTLFAILSQLDRR